MVPPFQFAGSLIAALPWPTSVAFSRRSQLPNPKMPKNGFGVRGVEVGSQPKTHWGILLLDKIRVLQGVICVLRARERGLAICSIPLYLPHPSDLPSGIRGPP